jgi:hypothetical protein
MEKILKKHAGKGYFKMSFYGQDGTTTLEIPSMSKSIRPSKALVEEFRKMSAQVGLITANNDVRWLNRNKHSAAAKGIGTNSSSFVLESLEQEIINI